MKNLGTYQRRGFLREHDPILQRVLVGSIGAEFTLVAGTVLGVKDGKFAAYTPDHEADCILAEDLLIPADGDAYALAYVHAAVIDSELIWGEGVSAEQQKSAIAALRVKGIYASEA